jgi:LysR family transcriptional regulator, regulator of abg operon
MKPHQLTAFVAVATHRSIRGAARALGVTPPAITKAVRELEHELDAPLIDRSVNGAELTAYGTTFASRAKLLLDDMARARQEISEMRNGATGHVRVASTTSFAQTLLVPAFRALRSRWPGVTMYFSDGASGSLLSRLREGHLDFAISHLGPGDVTPDLVTEPLFSVRLVVGVRHRHPLRHTRSLCDLLGAEWVVPGDESGEHFASGLFGSMGLPVPPRLIRGDSVVAALSLVGQTDLVGFFIEPLARLAFRHHGIRQIDLDDALPTLRVCTVHREGSPMTPASLHFIECVRELARNM